MDAPTADALNVSPHNGPPQSPDRIPVAVVARRRMMKARAIGSPVRRSPRLSCLPPPPPPSHPQDAQDPNESTDGESESANDVALHLFRDETPENDDFPPDEPSTILANRIMRAHDNPSPPPRDAAHPGINYVPGKDGQFPLHAVSVPPSTFRPINLLERLNQCSDPSFDATHTPRIPTSGVQPDISEPGANPSNDFISSESSSPFITSLPHEDLESIEAVPSLSTQYTVGDLPIPSQHSIAITSSLDTEVPNSLATQVVDSFPNATVPSASDNLPRMPPPCSERRQSASKSSPLTPNTKMLSFPSSDENGKVSPSVKTTAPGGQDSGGEEVLSVDKCRTTSTKELDRNSLQTLDSRSPKSINLLAGVPLALEPTLSTEQTDSPTDTVCTERQSTTPTQMSTPSVMQPNFPRISVQRPVIAPTPVRANSARKLNSPTKFSLEADEICRTPAQRIPMESALGRGTSSFQRTIRLTTGLDQSRSGRFMAIKAPVFTRPALDDPSRTPAKRIPITDLTASPTRGSQGQSSPARLSLRARSASVEPRPLGTILARSRSVEPRATVSKPDNHAKIRQPIFPTVHILPRAGAKLPFPLVPGQKSSGKFPPSIPEEREIGNAQTDATLGRVVQGNAVSQLRQSSINSRIPRIGHKPYARPPRSDKATPSTTTANTARAPGAPLFKLACKNNELGNNEVEVSPGPVQPTNDQHLVGSLKRKRGPEATAPPNSRPVMIRQVVPGMLSEKYAPKPAKFPSQVQAPSEPSPPKLPQPLKFRKVVDGMLSARYAPAKAKANLAQTELSDSNSLPPSPLSELSSSSDEGSPHEKLPPTTPPACSKGKTSDTPGTNVDPSAGELDTHEHSSLHQVADNGEPSSRPRRTSRARKPAQQQYILDVFNGTTSTRPPPARRKPQPRTEGDCFMGMSATALKALTTSNTTKNQQTVAVLATEVIRKEGLRPESPTVKTRTILQKQRDERDTRKRNRAQRRAQMSEEDLEGRYTEGQSGPDDRVSPDAPVGPDENACVIPQKYHRGPGDEEDYETPERRARAVEPLRLEGVDRIVKPVKQVKWHRGSPTAVYLDDVETKPKSLLKNVVVRGCLAPTSKNLPLDSLGNLVDLDNRLSPELISEHIVVKRYLYDNDIEPEPIPAKMTRSKSKKSKN